MRFQWHPSVLVAPVVFQCVPKMHLNTGLPLERHWAVASAGVVPVQSVQWYLSALRASGLEVIRSGHFPTSNPSFMYTTGMARVVWANLISFVLQPQIHKNYNGTHIEGMHRHRGETMYISLIGCQWISSEIKGFSSFIVHHSIIITCIIYATIFAIYSAKMY